MLTSDLKQMNEKKNICIVVSSPSTVKAFLVDQIKALSREYRVDIIANGVDQQFAEELDFCITPISIQIERKPNILKDVAALAILCKTFINNRYDLVHSITPKAGLLCMLAGALAGIKVRVHTFTGQVWATVDGKKRWLLKTTDKLISTFSTKLLVDSFSQRDFLIAEKVVTKEKAFVLANGSISGVNVGRFKPNAVAKQYIRSKFNISETAIVFLYMGRLNKDKGLIELAKAFARLKRKHTDVHLLVVGPDEENMRPLITEICSSFEPYLHIVNQTRQPERYMAAADVLCLPSHREGFGSVIIEAAAVGIPSIGSDIYGIRDAIEPDGTGLLFPVGDVGAISDQMVRISTENQLRLKMGKKAYERARCLFSENIVTTALLEYYHSVLSPSQSKAQKQS